MKAVKMEVINFTDKAARVTKIERHDGYTVVEWMCGGVDDHVTTDFDWPWEVRYCNDDGKIDEGWLIVDEDVDVKVGDEIPLLND
jgi:hypothetical protein